MARTCGSAFITTRLARTGRGAGTRATEPVRAGNATDALRNARAIVVCRS